jgi:hypothetical protein
MPHQFVGIYAGIARNGFLCPMRVGLRQLVRKTEQRMFDVEDRIELQRSIVAKMESAGAEAQVARQLLRAFQRSHLALTMHREQLRRISPPPNRVPLPDDGRLI